MTAHSPQSFDLPQMVAHADALEHNIWAMAHYCAEAGVLLAPHAKTTMSRQLLEAQLRAGAWGMTVATPRQARALVDFGIQRIVVANVIVDAPAIDWIAEAILNNGNRELICYVESVAGVEILDRELARHRPARPLQVLLEVGVADGRTGVRDLETAVAVAEAAARSDFLTLVGTAAFEGVLRGQPGNQLEGIKEFMRQVHRVTDDLMRRDLLQAVPIVSAGGSSYFDAVVEILGPQAFSYQVRTLLRSGCYVSHDHGLYHRTSPFDGRRAPGVDLPTLQPALELLASVWSAPEPGVVIAGFGRRDVPYDDQLPLILGYYDGQGQQVELTDWQVERLWDQHAFIRVPDGAELPPGTMLSVGISHPCGAFDRWREIPVIKDPWEIIDTLHPAL